MFSLSNLRLKIATINFVQIFTRSKQVLKLLECLILQDGGSAFLSFGKKKLHSQAPIKNGLFTPSCQQLNQDR